MGGQFALYSQLVSWTWAGLINFYMSRRDLQPPETPPVLSSFVTPISLLASGFIAVRVATTISSIANTDGRGGAFPTAFPPAFRPLSHRPAAGSLPMHCAPIILPFISLSPGDFRYSRYFRYFIFLVFCLSLTLFSGPGLSY